jgi:hypothetical protein
MAFSGTVLGWMIRIHRKGGVDVSFITKNVHKFAKISTLPLSYAEN